MAASVETEIEEGTSGQLLEWSWANAGAPGLRWAAKMNPLRWARGTPEAIAEQLDGYTGRSGQHAVRLRIVGSGETLEFADTGATARWIREVGEQDVAAAAAAAATPTTMSAMAAFTANLLAEPALALFCRFHASRRVPYIQRNIFAARAYARRACKPRRRCARRQRQQRADADAVHSYDVAASWQQFARSPAARLVPLVAAAALPEADRPATIDVSAASFDNDQNDENVTRWQRIAEDRDAPYWAAYERLDQPASCVLAFCGGDGSARDAVHHPGSPARAFVAGAAVDVAPALPLQLAAALLAQGKRIDVVGYSQGGLSALGFFLALDAQLTADNAQQQQGSLGHCLLLNCATAFWPPWLDALLGGTPAKHSTAAWWWTQAPPVAARIHHFLVENDPLSFSGPAAPAGPMAVPSTPGATVVLPARARGADSYLDNHAFALFQPPFPHC